MASIGLKYVAWGKLLTEPAAAVPTYDTGIVIGKAVSANLAITNAEAELFADDMLAEYASEFSSAALTMEVDNISLQNQATMYGASYNGGEMKVSADDTAPYGGIGGFQVLMVGGVRKYRAWFFPKAKASVPDWTGTTKSSSISFGTQPISLKIAAPAFGPWYYVSEFSTEAAAKAYIDNKLGVTAVFNVNIQVNGAGAGESVDMEGVQAIASGGSFVLAITGTPTALYDNGVDSVSSISDSKYTIASVSADHNIAVIF